MAFNKLFSYASVDIPNSSGHDEYHKNFLTMPCGTLTPSFVDFLVPGDKVDLSSKMHVQLPPMATDFYGRINLRTELFWVPCRILFGGWKDFITYPSEGIQGPAPDDPNFHAKYIPGISVRGTGVERVFRQLSINTISHSFENVSSASTQLLRDLSIEVMNLLSGKDLNQFFVRPSIDALNNVSAGSLADYLGFKVTQSIPGVSTFFWNDILTPRYNELSSPLTNAEIQSIIDGNTTYIYKNIGSGFVNSYDNNILLYIEGSLVDNVLSFKWAISNVYENGYDIPFGSTDFTINNILPFIAYHKIYDDWYRDARVQKPLFPSALSAVSASNLLQNVAYITKYTGGFDKHFYSGDNLNFYDGKSVLSLRQRLWQKDYFTTMTAQPQSGDPMKVSVDTSGDSGEFTIASLRVANSLQQWLERNNMVSPRYGDVMYAQYGVYPSDAVTDRCIYLGSNTIEVYNKSVYQQGEYSGNGSNPFNAIGAKYASPVGIGDGNLVNNYEVKEHGFLMAITSLVPEAYYSTGTRRYLHYDSIEDIAFPLLQGVGDQEVYAREIIDTYSGEGDKTVIGYQQRYAEYKFIEDQVHGLLRDGNSLESFALQRSFSAPPTLGTEFLEIPVEYLDQVSATNFKVSQYGCWINSNWDYKKVSKLSESNSIPTLGRMRDVHSISVPKSGTRL